MNIVDAFSGKKKSILTIPAIRPVFPNPVTYWVVSLKSVENVITLGKLIGLLFLFCLPLLSILFLKTKRNDLARPVMGTIFLVMHQFDHIMIITRNVNNTCS